MNIRAGLGEYVLQARNSKKFEDLMGGLNLPNPSPSGYASVELCALTSCKKIQKFKIQTAVQEGVTESLTKMQSFGFNF